MPYSLSRPPFIGRSQEYAWLINLWQRQPTGAVVLTGAADVGNSQRAAL